MAFDTNPFHAWTINGFLGPNIGQQAIAHQFTPAATETFTGAQIALTLVSGPGSVTVFLQADSNGLPGPVLEQINLTGLTGVPTIFAATSVLRPQLQSGTPYWLTVVAGGPGVLAGWNWNFVGDSSTGSNFAGTQGGSPAGPWGLSFPDLTRSAFQINGIAIDIKPGSLPNSINPRSNGVIPVAILTTPTFDATTVDPLTVRFGPNGAVEAHGRGHIEDADRDGDLDLVLHFRTQDTGIVCGDTSASLTGETFSGQAIEGSDSIRTVGCKCKWKPHRDHRGGSDR